MSSISRLHRPRRPSGRWLLHINEERCEGWGSLTNLTPPRSHRVGEGCTSPVAIGAGEIYCPLDPWEPSRIGSVARYSRRPARLHLKVALRVVKGTRSRP